MTTDNAGAPVRWQAAGRGTLSWARFGDGYVAYHRPSGKTHFLNAASHTLLTDTLAEPRPLAQIAAALAPEPGDITPELGSELDAMLRRFEQLGLVRRA